MRNILPWLTAAVVVGADRLTKAAVVANLEHGARLPVFPGLSLSHVRNPGIAFSLFADGGPVSRVVLHLVILTAVVVIAWMVVSHGRHTLLSGISFGLIMGGAVGNLIDRVLHGWVIDFIHVWVRIGDRVWSWPDFNLADSSITVGAVLLVIMELTRPKGADSASDPD